MPWYRLYSDKWIEQGGKAAASNNNYINLHKAMANSNYTALTNEQRKPSNASYYGGYISSLTSTRINLYRALNADATQGRWWIAIGMSK